MHRTAHHSWRWKVCGLFVGACAGATAIATAQTTAARSIDPAAIIVPSDAGHVVSRHVASVATTPAAPKLIFHIQDAHTNYEAQKHLAAIIDTLAKTYGVELVLVEGGVGYVGFSYLRDKAPLERRKAGVEKLLKAGEISGEEYQDIIADYPLTLWGIESIKLYNDNLKAYLDTEPIRERMQAPLAQLTTLVRQAAERRYPADLQALNQAYRAYEEGSMPFAEYLQSLHRAAKAAGLSLEAFPALTAFLKAQMLEARLDMAQVQTEQTQAIKALQVRAGDAVVAELLALGHEMSSGQRPAVDFYVRLGQLLQQHDLKMLAYPHLADYLEHMQLSSRIDTAQLSKELARCTEQTRARLAADPAIQALVKLEQEAGVLSRLSKLELTPEEYLTFSTALERNSLQKRWAAALRSIDAPAELLATLPDLERAIPAVAQFYTLARQRNHVMVNESLRMMDEQGVNAAILIAGGFHTPHLVKFLNERGAQVIVIAPKVTQATDEALYHHMLKHKSGIPENTPITPAPRHAAKE